MNEVKNAYPDGVCPDCGNEIPNDAPEGWGCPNCGHACYSEGNKFTVVCVAFDKPSMFSVRIFAANKEEAEQAACIWADWETGCGPYQTVAVFKEFQIDIGAVNEFPPIHAKNILDKQG